MMKIAITGATGFVGQRLVAALKSQNIPFVLMGRDIKKLQRFFPEEVICDYDAFLRGDYDQEKITHLIHLATLNNDVKATKEAFYEANVILLKKLIAHAQKINIKQVVNISSLHVFKDEKTAYGASKKQAFMHTQNITELNITTFFLPALYDDNSFKGKLHFLNHCPYALQKWLFSCLKPLAPTLSVKTLISEIIKLINSDNISEKSEIYLADNQDDNLFYKSIMKLIDYGFALGILFWFWWLLIGLWLWVKFDSKGGGIFMQPRIGKEGRVFTCYKFRTMAKGTKQAGTHEVSEAHVTKAGQFLRRYKLDELPQIINILKGELSLVGPRPGLVVQETLFAAREEKGVFNILPGITGLSQIQGIDMSDPEILANSDARYIAMRCVPLNIKIILKTFLGSGRGDNVA